MDLVSLRLSFLAKKISHEYQMKVSQRSCIPQPSACIPHRLVSTIQPADATGIGWKGERRGGGAFAKILVHIIEYKRKRNRELILFYTCVMILDTLEGTGNCCSETIYISDRRGGGEESMCSKQQRIRITYH